MVASRVRGYFMASGAMSCQPFDQRLIFAVAVRLANEPELRVAELPREKIEAFDEVAQRHVDRGYLSSEWTQDFSDTGKRILSKPWVSRNREGGAKTKSRFAHVSIP